jgi:hypothetical protein
MKEWISFGVEYWKAYIDCLARIAGYGEIFKTGVSKPLKLKD